MTPLDTLREQEASSMTPSQEKLLALAERVEKATGPDRELDRKIQIAVGRQGEARNGASDWKDFDWYRYTASLDAAEKLAGDSDWTMSKVAGQPSLVTVPAGNGLDDAIHAFAATPALALTAAALKARALAQGEEG